MRDVAVEGALIGWPRLAATRSFEGREVPALGELLRPVQRRIVDGEIVSDVAVVVP